MSRGGTLVGRDRALDAIDRWRTAVADDGALLGIVSGEPGIGKSSVMVEAARRARGAGARVLSASCSAATGTPYLPVLVAISPLVETARGGGRRDVTGSDVQVIDQLLLGPTEDGGDAGSTGSSGTPAAAFLAVTRLVLGAARMRPTVLVLDDLHDADDASFALLEHLLAAARHGADRAPLLTLVALRSDGGRPETARRVHRLRRSSGCVELSLSGLDEFEGAELLESLGPAAPTAQAARLVREQTEGNPLFMSLLWRGLLDSGAAVVRDGTVRVEDLSAPQLQEVGLEGVVDLRLDELDPATSSVVQAAAVLGATARLDEVADLVDRDVDEVATLLESAESVGLVHVRDEDLEFKHPLLRSAFARRGGRRGRRRQHLRAAHVVAALRGGDGAIRAAEHLRAAGSLATPAERRTFGLAAAERALAVGAWSAAVAGFDLALFPAPDDDWDDRGRALAHCRAAEAATVDQDHHACERHASATIRLADDLGDLEVLGRAIAALLRARVRTASIGSLAPDEHAVSFLERAGDDVPELVARIAGLLSERCFAALDLHGAAGHLELARSAARRAGDDATLGFVDFVDGLQRQGVFDLDGADRSFGAAVSRNRTAPDSARWSRARIATTTCLRGDLAGALVAVEDAADEAEQLQDWAELSLMRAWAAQVLATLGDWARVQQAASEALQLHRRTGYEFTAVVAHPPLAIARAVRGDLEGARATVSRWEAAGGGRLAGHLDLLLLAIGGEPEPLRAAMAQRGWRPPRPGPVTIRNASTWLLTAELASTLRDAELARAACGPLTELHRLGVRVVPGHASLVARLAGACHAAAGRPAEAVRWFDVAAADAASSGARAEAARINDDIGSEEACSPDAATRRAGIERRTQAATAFDELGMLTFLRRTESSQGIHDLHEGRRRRRAILFTDLVGSTDLNVALGNEAYVELLRAHDRIAREVLLDHDGTQFKHTGDGLAAWFASPTRAVDAALDLQDRIDRLLHTEAGHRVRIRCGASLGRPIEEAGDLFGLSVVTAARICAVADAGEVLISDDLATEIVGGSVAVHAIGDRSLKGLPEPVRIHQVKPS